jgi:GxxExxY protein
VAEIGNQDVTYKVIGAAMRVHNALGPGLKETNYHDALSAAMRDAGLAFEDEMPFDVQMDGESVGLLYLDHFVENEVVVEIKALSHLLTKDEIAQVITCLAVTESKVGLLINFGRPRLEYKRILPPTKFEDWRKTIGRYLWRPLEVTTQSGSHPFIRSLSVDYIGARS